MAEAQRRSINKEAEERKWRSRWVASAAAKSERLAHWQLVHQRYQGYHWETTRANWRPDPVLNYTFHVVQEHRSQLIQLQPQPVFRPRRPTDDKSANTLREVVRYGWQARRIPKIMDMGNLTTLLKGTAIYQVFWDPSIIGGTPEPFELIGPDGKPLMSAAGTLFKGDWNVRRIDPAHFFLDQGLPGPDLLQESAWCGVGELKLFSAMQARYPQGMQGVSPKTPDVLEQGYVTTSTQYGNAPVGDKYVYVFEGYEKLPADDTHKQAGYQYNLRKVVLVNWKLVDVQDYWYKHGLYPFVPQHDYPVEGQFWAMGEPQIFMALEKLVRKFYELFALNGLLTSNKQKILHPLSGLLPGNFTQEPGKVYMPGISGADVDISKILWPIPTDGLPAYVMEFVNMIKADIGMLTGLFNGLPPGVHAASAIIAIFEKMAARVKMKAQAAADASQGIVEQVFGLITENYTEQRVFRLTDPIDGVPWAKVRGADYAGMEFDVEIDFAATAPLSKAVMTEQASAAFDKGVLRGSEFLDALDFPNKAVIEAVRQREQQADTQKQMQQQMQTPLPNQPGQPPAPPPGPEMQPGPDMQGAPSPQQLMMAQLAHAGRG